jgi:ribA/ribD-fused uncharacterized protein
MEEEHSITRKQIENVLPYISLSTVAKDYFAKTRQWFYQRLNETKVNGKTVKFNQKELVTLSNALAEIGMKMQNVSKSLLNNQSLSTCSQYDKAEIYPIDESCIFKKTKEQYGEFSNMAGGFPLVINDITILTSEALYQACKYPDYPEIQQKIIDQKSPMAAKQVQKQHKNLIRKDWEDIKVTVMEWCVQVKFAQHKEKMIQLLQSTQNKYIVEENRNDIFWGAKRDKYYLHGNNVLGKLWMNLREYSNLVIHSTPPSIENFKLLGMEMKTTSKKTKSLILDMDLTLIDRGEVADYDYKKETIKHYCKQVPQFTLYEGWEEVFTFIRENNIKGTIVSDTHETIIKTVVSYFKIPCDYIVGHQSAKGKKKPNPFPMNDALRLLGGAIR